MDESRKQFEEWRISDSPTSNLYRDSHGQYAEIGTWIAWKAWQASREAIEIELPKVIVTGFEQIDSKLLAAYMGLNQIKQAIRAAGIKVKE